MAERAAPAPATVRSPKIGPGRCPSYLGEHSGPGMDQELEVRGHAHRVIAWPDTYVDEPGVHAVQHSVGETVAFEQPLTSGQEQNVRLDSQISDRPGRAWAPLLIDLDDLLAAIPHSGKLHSGVERRAGRADCTRTTSAPRSRSRRAAEGWTPTPPRPHSHRARPPRPGCRSTASPSPLSSTFPELFSPSRKGSVDQGSNRSLMGREGVPRGCSPTSKQHPAAG